MQFGLSRLKNWLQRRMSGYGGLGAQPELMARLSHELRTSLTGIVGYAQFLEVGSAEPMMNFTAKIIRESGQHLTRTSHAFFDLYALQQGQLRLTSQRFVLSDLAREVVKSHQVYATERDVSLGFTSAEAVMTQLIRADEGRVRQVLDALVFGAVHVAQKWSIVHVDLALDASQANWVLSVVTSGVPMDPVELGLLHAFWCDDDYRFKLQEGPGIELALAKALIGFLGGTAQLQMAVGEAPCLCVMFPCHPVDQNKGLR